MYDKVRKAWDARCWRAKRAARESARGPARAAGAQDHAGCATRTWLLSSANHRTKLTDLKQKGLDILPHRERMLKEDLESRFKDADDPLRLVFVCAMWITGFDVPTCSTIYLDKPMKNHTLMQTIARANRVRPASRRASSWTTSAYSATSRSARHLRAAPPRRHQRPHRRQGRTRRGAARGARQAVEFAEARSVRPADALRVTGFERQAALQDAAEKLLGDDEEKRAFLRLVGDAWKLFRAVLPDPVANEFRAT